MEFVILIAAIGAGIVAGWNMREVYAKRVVLDMIKETAEKVKKESIKIKLEKKDNTFYAFNFETDAFMGQAESFENIDKLLSDKFPGKKFLITEENMKEVGIEL